MGWNRSFKWSAKIYYGYMIYTELLLHLASNVLAFAELADRFQVDFAEKLCEQHLLNCSEMPLFDRFCGCRSSHLNNTKVRLFNSEFQTNPGAYIAWPECAS